MATNAHLAQCVDTKKKLKVFGDPREGNSLVTFNRATSSNELAFGGFLLMEPVGMWLMICCCKLERLREVQELKTTKCARFERPSSIAAGFGGRPF